ncbi:hypothetical protein HF995_04230 [Sanguibacter hominis ATCC BAA-789]|uniref:Uncharacterized protein n=1 Tax=Sanguibacter hominis ATCC BAA-789 TaxID=1312740 RepID=A0A9X5FDZ5_9MICO|nr:hypothetical protein [Sanguibacter hominis]NKX92489.1 hypothetical protein [Sanguibacter hominis ATCC BAA-789]
MAMRDASPVARSAWLTSVMDTGPKPAPLIPWRRFGKAGIAVLAVLVLVGAWLFLALTPSIERGDRTHLFDLAQVDAGDGRVLADPAGGTTTFAVEIRNASLTPVVLSAPEADASSQLTITFRPVTDPVQDPTAVPGDRSIKVQPDGVVEAVVTMGFGCGTHAASTEVATGVVGVRVSTLGLSTNVSVPLEEIVGIRTTAPLTVPCP